MVKFSKILIVSILGLAMALGLALAQTDTATVDSSVSSSTQVDISPNSFAWTNVGVGVVSSSLSAEIENIGSSNATKLSVDVNNANTYAPASGRVDNVDVGSILMASTDNLVFGYLNAKINTGETMPVYVTNTGGANIAAKGRFRFTEFEYFWEVANGNSSGGISNTCGNGTLRYFNTTANVHNRTQNGGIDVSAQSGVTLQLNAPAGDSTTKTDGWGFSDVTFNMPGNDPNGFNTSYCFAIRQDCTNAVLFKYNNNVGLGSNGINAYDNASLCTKDVYLINDATNGGLFKPGQMQRINFALGIPFGIANGSLLQSTVTVRATD